VRNGGDPKVYEGESSQIVVEAAIEFLRKTVKAGRAFFVVV
jgi:arylsulfatase A-like enzyme